MIAEDSESGDGDEDAQALVIDNGCMVSIKISNWTRYCNQLG